MFDEKENFEGEKKIAEMLSSLKRVREPGDFDTRVRARIARGPSGRVSVWSANLTRVGVPIAAAVVIAVGGYFAWTSINAGQNDAPTVAETRSEPQNLIVEQSSATIETSQSANRATVRDELPAENSNPDPTNDKPKTNAPNSADSDPAKNRPGAGSTEEAVREAQKLYPRGFSPNAKVPSNATGVNPSTRLHVSQILEFIGIKATWAGDGWRVDTVDANNIANRSGIKAGDVVEAINGQSVDKKTTFPAKFDGKSVRVRRDGSSLSIDFKP